MTQAIGEKYPCPECGQPGKRRTRNQYKKVTRYYMKCRACDIRYTVREEGGWLPDDLYREPTLAGLILFCQWVDDARAVSGD